MNIEEAKEILEEVRIVDDSIYQYNKAYLEALDMAIQALEAIPKIRAEIEEWGEDACVKEHGCYDEVMEILDKYCPKCERKMYEDKGVLEQLAEKQNNLSATNNAWSDVIEKNGYVN